MPVPASTLYPDWPRADGRLRDAVARLDADRLALRASPGHGAVWALESTFDVVRGCLERWPVEDLGRAVAREVGGVRREMTRASVLNRLFSHDAFHAGEISQVLGSNGLPGLDLWRRDEPPGR
jgi:hypothetical protein